MRSVHGIDFISERRVQVVVIKQRIARFKFGLFMVVSCVEKIKESRSDSHGDTRNDTLGNTHDGIFLTKVGSIKQMVGGFFKLRKKSKVQNPSTDRNNIFIPKPTSRLILSSWPVRNE